LQNERWNGKKKRPWLNRIENNNESLKKNIATFAHMIQLIFQGKYIKKETEKE